MTQAFQSDCCFKTKQRKKDSVTGDHISGVFSLQLTLQRVECSRVKAGHRSAAQRVGCDGFH